MNCLRRCKPLLGTYVEVLVEADSSDADLLFQSEQVYKAIEQVEQAMSFYLSSSELSYINQMAYKQKVSISKEMHEIISEALSLSELSNGKFDISVAPELIRHKLLPDFNPHNIYAGTWQDIELTESSIRFSKPLLLELGGIAKGYALDKGIEAVADYCQVIINAGGDIRMKHWQQQQVEIRMPENSKSMVLQVNMTNSAVATSAAYFQPDQSSTAIIEPESGDCTYQFASVSVFAPTGVLADALTKIIYLCKKPEAIIKKYLANALIIDHFGNIQTL